MAKIIEMSQHMADLIAAGEVVERPASVVKELIENAIDAGASALTVEIKNGGMTYMRITDDGCGMAPEDAETAFLRHATSKLLKEEELASIKTLGFRGEALAAISAVSRIDMFTRERGAQEGTSISLEGGKVIEKSPAGCPEGTTIIVRDLFFNTPARLKFMKKDSSEGSAVSSAVIRCALSHPEISIRYIKDEKEECHTPGDGRKDSCIYSVLGRDFSNSMVHAAATDTLVSVEGYISSPNGARGNRSHQFFFVNGRFVKSPTLQTALEQAYRNSLFTGRFPACVLYLTVNPSSVDVNVHPAKTEIKFLGEKQVFDAVYYAAKSALSGNTQPKIELEISKPKIVDVPKGDFQSIKTESEAPKPAYTEKRGEAPKPFQETGMYNRSVDFKSSVAAPEAAKPLPIQAVEQTRIAYNAAPAAAWRPKEEINLQHPATEPTSPKPQPPKTEDEAYRIIGETMNTYIIVERGESLLLIDKHAAHERMLFDRLKNGERAAMSQALITPHLAAVGREEAAELISQRELLEELGFEIDDFGSGTVAVSGVPADIAACDITALLTEVCEDIRLGKRPGSLGVKDEILASVACKAAIKAGSKSEPREYIPVVEKVVSGEIKYCPHGRPVSVGLTKRSLDRNFKRI